MQEPMPRKDGPALSLAHPIVAKDWQSVPAPELSSPVFALACTEYGVWAGGFGGVAWYSSHAEENAWQARFANFPFTPVTALLSVDNLLLAGGSGGIAFSRDGGIRWQQAELADGTVVVTSMVASPVFAHDQTVFAATLGNGIIRSTDGGRSWNNTSFGLENLEISTLSRGEGTTLLAATEEGIYRSRDSGRSWRHMYQDDELDIEALVCLPGGTILALFTDGRILRSPDNGRSWSQDKPSGKQIASLGIVGGETLLAGTFEHGILRSADQGVTWQTVHHQLAHAFASTRHHVYAGTATGVIVSRDNGLSWHDLPTPPIHDLHALQFCGSRLLLSGTYSGLFVAEPGHAWQQVASSVPPLTAAVPISDETLLISDTNGLARLSLDGQTREPLVNGPEGRVTLITTRQVGAQRHTWLAIASTAQLLYSADNETDWQALPTPFGILPLVALQALPDRLLAATYDPRQYRVNLWYSLDNGANWTHSVEAATSWPIVATCPGLPLLTIGNVLFLEETPGQWRQITTGDDSGVIRRVVYLQRAGKILLSVLTTTGLHYSEDMGETWRQIDEALPRETMRDIAGHGTTLYLLCAGGQLWQREIG